MTLEKFSPNGLNKGIISKRTGQNTVALVAFAATSRHMAPYDDTETEVWSLNEAYTFPSIKRFDRLFQIHFREQLEDENQVRDKNHLKWLQDNKTIPVYMQEKHEDIPMSIEYPLQSIINTYGRFMKSSLAYMFLLAMREGFDRIELYGIEMGLDSEYGHQRPNMMWCLGMAKGLGITVYMPEFCQLQPRGKLYGYEERSLLYRHILDVRAKELEVQRQDAMNSFLSSKSKTDTLRDLIKTTEDNQHNTISVDLLRQIADESDKEALTKAALVNVIRGAQDERAYLTAIYDSHYYGEGESTKLETDLDFGKSVSMEDLTNVAHNHHPQ